MPHSAAIYVSHSWSIGDGFGKIVRVLNGDPEFACRFVGLAKDDPIHETAADYELRVEMRRMMTDCQLLLVNAGNYKALARWVDEEIDLARGGFSHRRRVLVVVPFGAEAAGEALRARADVVMPWRPSEIVACAKQLAALPRELVRPHEHAAASARPAASVAEGLRIRSRLVPTPTAPPARPGEPATTVPARPATPPTTGAGESATPSTIRRTSLGARLPLVPVGDPSRS